MSGLCGVFNVYKEAGWTSFDVVAKMRGICGERKVGHAGTLDPAAEGVLPICVGRATKIASLISNNLKSYRADITLGIETDSLDSTGTVIRRADPDKLAAIEESDVSRVAAAFVGGYEQLPPMYSAKHMGGKRLYDLAREGKVVERDPVFVRIDRIEIVRSQLPSLTIEVTCGAGTYIRSLCADIGERLGVGAVMTGLVRTRVGAFDINSALRIDRMQAIKDEGRLADSITTVDKVFGDKTEALVLAGASEQLACNGNKIPLSGLNFKGADPGEELFRLYNEQGTFFGLYRIEGRREAKPVCFFYENR